MNIKLFKDQIRLSLNHASSIDEGLINAIKILVRECNSKYAILWLQDGEDAIALHPYYWICPFDITSAILKSGEGAAGLAFEKKQIKIFLDDKNTDSFVEEYFKDYAISSSACVPIIIKNNCIGVIQLINTVENGEFNKGIRDYLNVLLNCIERSNLKYDRIIRNLSDDVILSTRDIKKDYINGNVESNVLKGVNLDVYQGELLTLLGPSGSGKTTLLNIIGGMDKASSGSVSYLDNKLEDFKETDLTKYRRDNIGFIFQSYNLMPNLTAKQNLDLIGELVKNPMSSTEALSLVDMSQKADSYPSQLSGGQQQRISIARALIKKPKVIMADEPTAALDYKTSITVLEVLKRIVNDGTTIVMVTHNEEIAKMANRVVRLRDGKIYEVSINSHPVDTKDLVW